MLLDQKYSFKLNTVFIKNSFFQPPTRASLPRSQIQLDFGRRQSGATSLLQLCGTRRRQSFVDKLRRSARRTRWTRRNSVLRNSESDDRPRPIGALALQSSSRQRWRHDSARFFGGKIESSLDRKLRLRYRYRRRLRDLRRQKFGSDFTLQHHSTQGISHCRNDRQIFDEKWRKEHSKRKRVGCRRRKFEPFSFEFESDTYIWIGLVTCTRIRLVKCIRIKSDLASDGSGSGELCWIQFPSGGLLQLQSSSSPTARISKPQVRKGLWYLEFA